MSVRGNILQNVSRMATHPEEFREALQAADEREEQQQLEAEEAEEAAAAANYGNGAVGEGRFGTATTMMAPLSASHLNNGVGGGGAPPHLSRGSSLSVSALTTGQLDQLTLQSQSHASQPHGGHMAGSLLQATPSPSAQGAGSPAATLGCSPPASPRGLSLSGTSVALPTSPLQQRLAASGGLAARQQLGLIGTSVSCLSLCLPSTVCPQLTTVSLFVCPQLTCPRVL